VDLHRGELLDTARSTAIKRARAPYKRWLKQGVRYLESDLIDRARRRADGRDTLRLYQKMFNLTREERDGLRVLAETEQRSGRLDGRRHADAGAVDQVRSLYDYFRQPSRRSPTRRSTRCARAIVMSLQTQIGRESQRLRAERRSTRGRSC
jgi:glutamate synthase (NADPH) large chain